MGDIYNQPFLWVCLKMVYTLQPGKWMTDIGRPRDLDGKSSTIAKWSPSPKSLMDFHILYIYSLVGKSSIDLPIMVTFFVSSWVEDHYEKLMIYLMDQEIYPIFLSRFFLCSAFP